MINHEQEFLELVIKLYATEGITGEEQDTLLEFHSQFLELKNQISIGTEQLEELEDNIYSLKRDNDILRDELDKI